MYVEIREYDCRNNYNGSMGVARQKFRGKFQNGDQAFKAFQKLELTVEGIFLRKINLATVGEKLEIFLPETRDFKAKFLPQKLNSFLSSYALWKNDC